MNSKWLASKRGNCFFVCSLVENSNRERTINCLIVLFADTSKLQRSGRHFVNKDTLLSYSLSIHCHSKGRGRGAPCSTSLFTPKVKTESIKCWKWNLVFQSHYTTFHWLTSRYPFPQFMLVAKCVPEEHKTTCWWSLRLPIIRQIRQF